MTEESTVAKRIFPFYEDYSELIIRISNAPKRMLKASVYYPMGKHIGVGALETSGYKIKCNNIPREGYSYMTIDQSDLNKVYYIFKNTPISFEDAIFLPDNQKVLLFNCVTAETKECSIIWHDYGYHNGFEVTFSDGSTCRFDSTEYDKKFCFLVK